MTEARTRRSFVGATVLAVLAASLTSTATARDGERGARAPVSQDHAEQREKRFRELPSEEQQRLRDAENRYRNMSPQQREELRERWRSKSKSERERYRRRIERNER